MKEYWKNNKRTILIAIVVLIIVIIIISAIRKAVKRKQEARNQQAATNFGSVAGSTGAANVLDVNKVLAQGSTGDEVKELQKLLKEAFGVGGISVDGNFGPQTQSALQSVTGNSSVKLKDIYDSITGINSQAITDAIGQTAYANAVQGALEAMGVGVNTYYIPFVGFITF